MLCAERGCNMMMIVNDGSVVDWLRFQMSDITHQARFAGLPQSGVEQMVSIEQTVRRLRPVT